MTLEIWILIGIGAAIAAFFGGRASASGRTEVSRLQAEVERLTSDHETFKTQAAADLANTEADAAAKAAAVEAGVSSHFEQSAALFGKLALDYRAFLEHFSESAQQLGLSEARTRELIDQVAQPMLRHDPAGSPGPDSEDEIRVAADPSKDSSVEPPTPTPNPKADAKTDPKSAAKPNAKSGARKVPAKDPSGRGAAVPTLDPISAKVAEIELEEALSDARGDTADAPAPVRSVGAGAREKAS